MVIAVGLGFVALWIAMRVRVARRQVRLEAGTFAGLAEELMALDMASADPAAPASWGDLRRAA